MCVAKWSPCCIDILSKGVKRATVLLNTSQISSFLFIHQVKVWLWLGLAWQRSLEAVASSALAIFKSFANSNYNSKCQRRKKRGELCDVFGTCLLCIEFVELRTKLMERHGSKQKGRYRASGFPLGRESHICSERTLLSTVFGANDFNKYALAWTRLVAMTICKHLFLHLLLHWWLGGEVRVSFFRRRK